MKALRISNYSTNNLNQYQAIVETLGEAVSNRFTENPSSGNSSTTYFTPLHDADGNAVLIRTSTGVWQITYNGANRPVRFENASTETVITCAYDSQGRRFEKKVTVAGAITSWERYLYRSYLQVAAFDVSQSGETLNYALKRIIYWDPSEPTATRPLAIFVANDQLYFPTVDLTKNVCELIDVSGTLAATYDYAPFGAVTSSGTVSNPLQWSSEHYDSELGLVYYNYRHYSPYDGRFLSRDPIEEQGGRNLYAFIVNSVFQLFDKNGWLAEKITISADQVSVESGYVEKRFLAGFEKGQRSVSLRLAGGFNLFGVLVAEGKAEGMRIVYGKSFTKESFLKSSSYLHEKTHFDNYKKEYNALVADFNSYDGKELSAIGRICCGCSKKLSSYVEKRKALFRVRCEIADLTLEYNDYTPAQLQHYYNKILNEVPRLSDRTYSESELDYARRVRDAFWERISDFQGNEKELEGEVDTSKKELDKCF